MRCMGCRQGPRPTNTPAAMEQGNATGPAQPAAAQRPPPPANSPSPPVAQQAAPDAVAPPLPNLPPPFPDLPPPPGNLPPPPAVGLPLLPDPPPPFPDLTPPFPDLPPLAQNLPPPPQVAPAPAAAGPVQMPPPYFHTPANGAEAMAWTVKGPIPDPIDTDLMPCGAVRQPGDADRPLYLEFQAHPNAIPPDHPVGSPANEHAAHDLAVLVVQRARALLRKGPFNNRGGLPDAIANRDLHPRTEDARADWIHYHGKGLLDAADIPFPPAAFYVIDAAAANENMPGGLMEDFTLMSSSTQHVAGGVCEKFSTVVLGLVSQLAPPGTEACKIAWSGDHHYIVLRVGDSQWWVADPWPHNSFVHPWSQNYFTRDQTTLYVSMTVHEPVTHAYGVVMNNAQIGVSYVAAAAATPFTLNDGAFDHNWANAHNIRYTKSDAHQNRTADFDYYFDSDAGYLSDWLHAATEDDVITAYANQNWQSLAANATDWG